MYSVLGAEPAAAADNPLNIPLKPPDFRSPCGDWSRVLIVSMGYNVMSTVNPATAPDIIALHAGIESFEIGIDSFLGVFLCIYCAALVIGEGKQNIHHF